MGRSDVAVEVSILSRHTTMPHHGHIDKEFNIFSYLKCHPNSKLLMNPDHMYFREHFKSRFKDDAEWFKLYGEVKD